MGLVFFFFKKLDISNNLKASDSSFKIIYTCDGFDCLGNFLACSDCASRHLTLFCLYFVLLPCTSEARLSGPRQKHTYECLPRLRCLIQVFRPDRK